VTDAEHTPPPKPAKPGKPWRMRLRGLHRDFGFFAVGLTIIYATSGIAVNHIGDWNPSYSDYEYTTTVPGPLPNDDKQAAAAITAALDIPGEPDVFALRDTVVHYAITVGDTSIEVHTDTMRAHVAIGDDTRTHQLADDLPAEDWAAALSVLKQLDIDAEPDSVERIDYPTRELNISFERVTITAHDLGDQAEVHVQGENPRFFLYVANWLHLNRGKQAWTYIADFYAVVLLFLAASGMLMVKGRQGIFGRGGVFLLIGIAVPVIYIILAGP
jgi:hypothetical protein